MRGGTAPTSYAAPPRRPHPTWAPPRQPPKPPPPPPKPLTPAERLRNVLLAAGGVLIGAVLFVRPAAPAKEPVGYAAPVPDSAPRATPPEKKAVPGYKPVPDYYKRRTSKGTVRVRSSDAYESVVDAPKSRSAEEGLGSSLSAVGSLLDGASPSKAAASSQPHIVAATAASPQVATQHVASEAPPRPPTSTPQVAATHSTGSAAQPEPPPPPPQQGLTGGAISTT